jgi:hypothetical protein
VGCDLWFCEGTYAASIWWVFNCLTRLIEQPLSLLGKTGYTNRF